MSRGLLFSCLLAALAPTACDDPAEPKIVESTCGDGLIQDAHGEVCDGPDLGGFTCTSVGLREGLLRCAPTCDGFDTSGCGGACGDDLIQSGEVCDGDNLAGATCESEGHYTGTLACATGCDGFDFANCEGTCGDGVIQDVHGEVCDSTDLNGQTCSLQGQYPGELRCADDCRSLDKTGCGGRCGDTVIQYGFGESCDGYYLGGAS